MQQFGVHTWNNYKAHKYVEKQKTHLWVRKVKAYVTPEAIHDHIMYVIITHKQYSTCDWANTSYALNIIRRQSLFIGRLMQYKTQRLKSTLYQCFKRRLKTPTCFGSFMIHPQGVLNVLDWNYLWYFCVPSRCLAAWFLDPWGVCLVRRVPPGTHTTGPKITLPNTNYAHKNITSNFSQACSTLPEDGS